MSLLPEAITPWLCHWNLLDFVLWLFYVARTFMREITIILALMSYIEVVKGGAVLIKKNKNRKDLQQLYTVPCLGDVAKLLKEASPVSLDKSRLY